MPGSLHLSILLLSAISGQGALCSVFSTATAFSSIRFQSDSTSILLINILLGLAVFALIIAASWAVARDLRDKRIEHRELKQIRRELAKILPRLGLTLYDGGEKVNEKRK